jgi:hypothetical protein
MLAWHCRPVVPSLALVVALAGAAPAGAQSPEEWRSTREYCVKVLPGKARAYEAFLRDVTVPLNRARVEAGEFETFAAERAVIPAGSSARCDYLLAYTYKGIPPEEATTEQLDGALRRAGLRLTAEQMADQRSALIELVGVNFWGTMDSAGGEWAKGSYVTFNHHKVKDGQFDGYARLEKTWKPLVEARIKAGSKQSWLLTGLWMPQGDAVPYNAMTIDVFPSWGELMKAGASFMEEWKAVHPDMPFQMVEDQKAKVRTVYASELFRVVDIVSRGTSR